jgi:hypothetical protein
VYLSPELVGLVRSSAGSASKPFGTGAGSHGEDMNDTDEQHGDPYYREPLGC